MKTLLIFVFGLTTFFNISAQDAEIRPASKNEFGFHAGATTGIGLSYRHWFGKAGFQLTGLPIKTNKVEYYSVGLTALYSVYNSRHIRFFGYLGNHYVVDNESKRNDKWNNGSFTIENEDTEYKSYNIGIGPGFEFGTVVRFNLMVGYGFYDVTGSFEIYPTGELGLYYNF
jgi:hypothetical protein